ncbi:hypothetical protein ABPG77_008225 [Micractinium sp. CCAP 211/92]
MGCSLRRPATTLAGAAVAAAPHLAALLLVLLGCACPSAGAAQSTGGTGVAATAAGRSVDSILAGKWLPGGYDWSRAGKRRVATRYAGGERAIPSPTGPIFDVTAQKYGAVGNGKTPCDGAFKAAIRDAAASPRGGVVYVPPGSFLLNYPLYVNVSRVIIRGAGPTRSTLLFGRSLGQIYKGSWKVDACSGKVKSVWTADGGLVTFSGKEARDRGSKVLAQVIADAQPGDRRLYLNSTQGIRVGQMYQLLLNDNWKNPGGDAPPRLPPLVCQAAAIDAQYGGTAQGPVSGAAGLAPPGSVAAWVYGDGKGDSGGRGAVNKNAVRFLFRVRAVGRQAGRPYMDLDRDLVHLVRRVWYSQVADFNPGIVDSGIEHLTVTFKNSPGKYAGHLTERGYNAVNFYGATNCWARDLRIINPDSGVLASKSDFITAADIVIDFTFDRSTPNSDGNQGHHAFNLGPGQGYLMTRFDVRKRFYHDLTASQGTLLSVYSRGRGLDICMDNHRGGPMANLFTNINLGKNTRAFQSSGRKDRGAHTGRGTAFWNVFSTAKPVVELPDCDYGPYLSFMLPRWKGNTCSAEGWWVGTWKSSLPPDLFVAQAAERRRLAKAQAGK